MITDEAYIAENLFRVADKEGNDVDFKLNTVQKDLDDSLSGRDLVPKARQEGVSTYFLARYTAACLGKRNVRAVVISHDQESTQRMLKKVRYFLENLRGPPAKIQNMSANEITFPKTNSMFYLGTAGSRKFGRGDTITHLHCSEYAYWPNPPDLMRGLMQAVPRSGEIAIESTGNGLNDYYHRCMRSYSGNSRWAMHFFPWHTFPEYAIELDEYEEEMVLESLDEAMEEPELVDQGITPGQIAWRREKLEELDYDMKGFKQEYPMTLDECFQMTGESLFHRVLYKPTDSWKEIERGLWLLDGHPNPKYAYALGADVGAGVGRDNSAIEVICLDTHEQVGEYASNRIDPQEFGNKVNEVGRRFGCPFAVVENNNHGLLTLAVLEGIYPPGMLFMEPLVGKTEEKQLMRLGHKTTSRTKPLIVGNLRGALANDMVIHSPLLNGELSTFIEHENGQLGAQGGCMDDTVIAMAMAVRGINEAAMYRASGVDQDRRVVVTDPFSLDAILKEMGQGGSDWPIRPQDGWVN